MGPVRFAVAALALLCCATAASAAAPSADTTALAHNISFVDRTNLNDAIIPPMGCLTFSITSAGALGECIANSTDTFLQQGITTKADFARHNITTSWWNATEESKLASNCSGTPSVVQVFEVNGCVLAKAAADTVGLGNTNIMQSYVCTNQGTDTTAYTGLWGYNTEELALCKDVKTLAQSTANSVSLESGKVLSTCSKRITYIVSNPCATNLTVVMQNKYSIAFAEVAPAPAPVMAPVPATSALPVMAPLPSTAAGKAPVTAPALAPAPGVAVPASGPSVAASPSTSATPAATAGKNSAAAATVGSAMALASAAAFMLF